MVKKKSAVVLVFNRNGELALQLRAAHDDSFPLHWDFSAAGGIDEGEDPAAAATRELKEEIGVDGNISFVTERLCTYLAWQTNEPEDDYVYVYKISYDGQFSLDPNEVQEIRFLSLDEIRKKIEGGGKFHPEFKLFWDCGVILTAAASL